MSSDQGLDQRAIAFPAAYSCYDGPPVRPTLFLFPCFLVASVAWAEAGAETPRTVTGQTPAPSGSRPRAATRFGCTLVLGVAVTAEWFEAGFEQGVDGDRWEAITKPHTSLEQWADPKDAVWAVPPRSPCAARATDPDRILFTAMNWEYETAAPWVIQLSAVINVIKKKYPRVREIDLLTMIRAPRNMSCGSPMSVVQPFVDEAIATVSRQFSGLVRPGPKFEVPACDVFRNGGPHFTSAGSATVARLVSEHYAGEH